jgi:hypothetical protein
MSKIKAAAPWRLCRIFAIFDGNRTQRRLSPLMVDNRDISAAA